VNNDKFYKQSLNRYILTRIPKLNKLPKLKRIEINKDSKTNNDYSFPSNFKETIFYDDSLLTQNYNIIHYLGDSTINKPRFNKLPQIDNDNKYEFSINKTHFSYLKEINLKQIGKKRQEYITLPKETASDTFNPRKRTSRELELSPENLKKAKIQIEDLSRKEQVCSFDIKKIRIYVNSFFFISNSKNGTFNTDFINVIKSIISKFEVIVFEKQYFIEMDIIMNKKYGGLFLSPDNFKEDLLGNHNDNKYIKVIETLDKNLLRFELIFLIFTKESS
jgi:hypothetical protein